MKKCIDHEYGQICIYADKSAACEGVAEYFLQIVEDSLKKRGSCHIALAGGSTPEMFYQLLAGSKYREQIAWPQLHFYFGDERYVPADDAQSNYRMANAAMFQQVPLPAENIHAIPTQAGDPDTDALAYAETLRNCLAEENAIPVFDLILLGMGDDGHTASLFPGTTILQETQKLAAAVYVEKFQSWRISLTYPVLNQARHVYILVTGSGKTDCLKLIFSTQPHEPMPIERLQVRGECVWFLDKAAAGSVL